MALILEQKYESFPTFGFTLGKHRVKVGAQTASDSITVRPLLNSNAAVLVNNETTAATTSSCALTFATSFPDDGDTVVIGGVTYTYETGTLDAPYKIKAETSAAVAATYLIAAINGTTSAGVAANTPPHPLVTAATGGSGVVTITSIRTGAQGKAAVLTIPSVTGGGTGTAAAVHTFGVGGAASVTSATSGTIRLNGFSTDDIVEIITYHGNVNNSTSIG